MKIPSNAEIGTYKGIIEVNGMDQSKQLELIINVEEGTFNTLLSFLNTEIMTLPFSSTPSITGAVVGNIDEQEGKPLKMWHVLSTISMLGACIFLANKFFFNN